MSGVPCIPHTTFDLCVAGFDRHHELIGPAKPQYGDDRYYCRRRPADSRLDSNGSLVEQFNVLRVINN